MAHVSNKEWKFCLNIDTITIPAQYGINGETETKIVDAWKSTVGFSDAGKVEKYVQIVFNL